MTIEGFVDYYVNCTIWPKFISTGKCSEKYYDLEKSTKYLKEIMIAQFGDIREVLETFYRIFNRQGQKLNTILLKGDAGSGKNYTMDAFTNFFITVGYMNSLSKYDMFATSGLIDARVGVAHDIKFSLK